MCHSAQRQSRALLRTGLFSILFSALFLLSWPTGAQTPPTTGMPPFGSFTGAPDVIDLANLNTHLTIPILHKPGRGTDFSYDLNYDSSIWYPLGSSGQQSWQPVGTWGWQGLAPAGAGYVIYAVTYTSSSCYNGGPVTYYEWSYSNFVYHDPLGVPHYFSTTPSYFQSPGGSNCPPNGPMPSTPQASLATDGSGYTLYATPSSGVAYASIVTPTGSTINPPAGTTPPGSQGSTSLTDRNGNQISSSNGVYTDTLGQAALTVAGTAPSNTTLTYLPPTGGTAAYTVQYTNYTVATNFAISTIKDYKSAAAVPLVSSILLPDGSQYTFTYEATPSTPSSGACTPYAGTTCVTARLSKVTLPTGGSLTYGYSGGAGTNGSGIFADGSAATLTRSTPDGSWTYAQVKGSGAASTTTVTDPQGNVTQIQFQGIYETQRVVNQGPSTLLQTVNTCYNYVSPVCTSNAITLPISQRTITTVLTNNQQNQRGESYNSHGLLTYALDCDYGPSPHGPCPRQTIINYATTLGNITSFPQSVTICNNSGTSSACNGSGTVFAQTTYGYDEASLAPTSGLPQHVAVGGPRGNLTSVNKWLNTTNTNLTSLNTYFDTGMINTSSDPANNKTTFSYSSTFGGARLTQIQDALGHTTSFNYEPNSDVLISVVDPNNANANTKTTINYDNMMRPTQTVYPDGGQFSLTYNSSTSITATTKMTSSQNAVETILLDGLGRISETEMTSDPQGTDYTLTTYDPLGRVHQVYNPTRCSTPTSNCGEATWGITSYTYDALSRVKKVTDPDGSLASADYTNNTVTTTDEAGKKRQLQIDSLGRITQVTEDPGGLSYVTTYSYDPLSNLTNVLQNGSRQRTFAYDSLSRLTSETDPETGNNSTTISYLTSSGALCSGDPTAACSQTDALGLTTTYQYDALNRIMSKGHSDGSTGAIFTYDVNNPFNHPVTNPIGRLVGIWTGYSGQWVNWQAFGYDPVGRLVTQYDCLPQAPSCQLFTTTLGYDLAGDLTSLVYPSGRAISYQYNGARFQTQATFASANGISVGYNYLTNATYAPHGAPASLPLGNGLTETLTYNNLLQRASDKLASSIQTFANRSFGFTSGQNNGDVMSITDNLQSNRTQTFSYDSLNRLSTAQSNATSGSDCWAQQFGYDAWSNLLTATPTRSGCPMTQLNVGVNANNQITNSGFSYDAAGNLHTDGSHTYTYDAEDRLSQVDNGGTATYTYTGAGLRVQKQAGNTTQYVFLGSQSIAEYQPATNGWSDYIYSGGTLLARADTYEDRVHIWGTECSSCGSQWEKFTLGNPGALAGHLIQSGDKLYLYQWQGTGTRAGVNIVFSDSTDTHGIVNDQDGNPIDADNPQNIWHYRRVDLSQFAGKTITQAQLMVEGLTQPGRWDVYYHDISVVSSDGTVYPLYARQTSISLSPSGTSGMTSVGYEINHNGGAGQYPQVTTNYYHGDHLGSTRLMSSVNGYPVWSATYLPFGQEWNPQMTVNHYKFTGDESDSESNLDHTQFRQYSSSFSRWMTPDPAGLAAVDPTNPQSWNRYAYVLNDPLDYIDPDGLFGGPCGSFDDPCSVPGAPEPPPPCQPPYICPTGPTGPTNPGVPNPISGGGITSNSSANSNQSVQKVINCNRVASAAAAARWKKATTPPDPGDVVGGGVIAGAARLLKASNPVAILLGFANVFRNQIGSGLIAAFQYSSAQTGCNVQQGVGVDPAAIPIG